MIAEEMKEYCYSENEMAAILGGSKGALSPSTMRGRIHRKRNIPPSIKVGPDYWFPKDLYADWLRSLRPTFEVKRSAS